jgi:hypothetical protein
MGRTIVITGLFETRDRFHMPAGKKFMVSHGIDEDTGRNVILPNESPIALGAKYDEDIGEWVLE